MSNWEVIFTATLQTLKVKNGTRILKDTVVISLMSIVFISVIVGAVLPLILHGIKVDPAHAATSVQVIMDISGCFLTMFFTRLLLESETGLYIVGFLVRTE